MRASISGFPEFLPHEQIAFDQLIATIRAAYERFGFAPLETSSVERKQVLTAKAGVHRDRQIYSVSRLSSGDGGDLSTDLALRFDLTVPLARYVADNYANLTFPFRCYQIQKVWRGERPQAGRYHEFYQCDVDVVGDGRLSLLVDAEIPNVIYNVFTEMRLGRFVIRISNRKILDGYLELLRVPATRFRDVARVLDSLERVGVAQAISELVGDLGLEQQASRRLIDFVDQGSEEIDEQIGRLQKLEGPALLQQGVQELAAVVEGMRSWGLPDDAFAIDLRISRGLDYYTGTVYETVLVDHLGVGSVCSGGRYDNLAGHFANRKLPGVGISIGLTRLFSSLLQTRTIGKGPSTAAPVLVTTSGRGKMADYFEIARLLRGAEIGTEIYLDERSLGDQLRYASRKGFRLVLFAGEDDFARNEIKVKDLDTGITEVVARNADLGAAIVTILKRGL